MADLIINGNGKENIMKRSSRNNFIIYAYNELIIHYEENMDKISSYGNTVITPELLKRVKSRRAELKWGKPNG